MKTLTWLTGNIDTDTFETWSSSDASEDDRSMIEDDLRACVSNFSVSHNAV